jgi:hypothetical protein
MLAPACAELNPEPPAIVPLRPDEKAREACVDSVLQPDEPDGCRLGIARRSLRVTLAIVAALKEGRRECRALAPSFSDAVKSATDLAPPPARDRIPHAVTRNKTNHQTDQYFHHANILCASLHPLNITNVHVHCSLTATPGTAFSPGELRATGFVLRPENDGNATEQCLSRMRAPQKSIWDDTGA